MDNFSKLIELKELYEKYSYNPEKDEKAVAYLFREGMTKEEKLSALAGAGRTARSSGYCDAMANIKDSGYTFSYFYRCNAKRCRI